MAKAKSQLVSSWKPQLAVLEDAIFYLKLADTPRQDQGIRTAALEVAGARAHAAWCAIHDVTDAWLENGSLH